MIHKVQNNVETKLPSMKPNKPNIRFKFKRLSTGERKGRKRKSNSFTLLLKLEHSAQRNKRDTPPSPFLKLDHRQAPKIFLFLIGKLCTCLIGLEPTTLPSTQHLRGEEVAVELELIGDNQQKSFLFFICKLCICLMGLGATTSPST